MRCFADVLVAFSCWVRSSFHRFQIEASNQNGEGLKAEGMLTCVQRCLSNHRPDRAYLSPFGFAKPGLRSPSSCIQAGSKVAAAVGIGGILGIVAGRNYGYWAVVTIGFIIGGFQGASFRAAWLRLQVHTNDLFSIIPPLVFACPARISNPVPVCFPPTLLPSGSVTVLWPGNDSTFLLAPSSCTFLIIRALFELQ